MREEQDDNLGRRGGGDGAGRAGQERVVGGGRAGEKGLGGSGGAGQKMGSGGRGLDFGSGVRKIGKGKETRVGGGVGSGGRKIGQGIGGAYPRGWTRGRRGGGEKDWLKRDYA